MTFIRIPESGNTFRLEHFLELSKYLRLETHKNALLYICTIMYAQLRNERKPKLHLNFLYRCLNRNVLFQYELMNIKLTNNKNISV